MGLYPKGQAALDKARVVRSQQIWELAGVPEGPILLSHRNKRAGAQGRGRRGHLT